MHSGCTHQTVERHRCHAIVGVVLQKVVQGQFAVLQDKVLVSVEDADPVGCVSEGIERRGKREEEREKRKERRGRREEGREKRGERRGGRGGERWVVAG